MGNPKCLNPPNELQICYLLFTMMYDELRNLNDAIPLCYERFLQETFLKYTNYSTLTRNVIHRVRTTVPIVNVFPAKT